MGRPRMIQSWLGSIGRGRAQRQASSIASLREQRLRCCKCRPMRLDFGRMHGQRQERPSWRRCSTGTARWAPTRPSARRPSIGWPGAIVAPGHTASRRRLAAPAPTPLQPRSSRRASTGRPLRAAAAAAPTARPAPAAPRQFPATAPDAAVMAARSGRPAKRRRSTSWQPGSPPSTAAASRPRPRTCASTAGRRRRASC